MTEPTPIDTCPCGHVHYYGTESAALFEGTIPVLVPERNIAYKVPRVYIAFHGLKAAELEELARGYCWDEV